MAVTVLKLCVALFFMWQTSAYTADLCSKQSDVMYTLYNYNYNVNIDVYHCPVNETSSGCAVGVSVPITKSNTQLLQDCLTKSGRNGTLTPPFYYENTGGNATKFNVTLCTFTAKAQPLRNVMYFPPPFKTETLIRFGLGQYFDRDLGVNVTWSLDYNCTIVGTIYSGPVDVYTIEDYAYKYLVGRSSNSEFSLELRSRVNVCTKSMRLTDQFGVLASGSEPLKGIPMSENSREFNVRSLLLKICYLDLLSKSIKGGSEQSKGLGYLVLGVGLCFVFMLVLVSFLYYFLLKKIKKRTNEPEIYYKFSGVSKNDDRKPVVASTLLPSECLRNDQTPVENILSHNSQEYHYAYADLEKLGVRF